ncbi:hypothetical protein ACFXP3_39390, partial [Streptomyces sp. NPDC059096]|uniref:hypothetical protein n=1 Tax=Streptomyces sp. NPDC059096 TaxID=3346727 RepID=UPI003682E16E
RKLLQGGRAGPGGPGRGHAAPPPPAGGRRVEARVVRKALRAAAEGEPVPLDGIADLVSTELWLRRLLSRRGTCWTGTAAPRQRAVAGGVVPRPTLRS